MTTHAEWNKHTTATEVASAFADEIQGRNVLITGVSPKSIGAATAKAIASQRPNILILASRTASKLDAVTTEIRRAYPSVRCETIVIDLSSFNSVWTALPEIKAALGSDGGLDVLINNAGVNVTAHQFTADGIEMQWQTNHLGPFLLTRLLLPRLRAAAGVKSGAAVRVVNVASDGHILCPIRFSDTDFQRPINTLPEQERPKMRGLGKILPREGNTYSPFLAYAQSKTANILTAQYMAHNFRADGIEAFSVHPGFIWTELARDLDEETTKLVAASNSYRKTIDQGAATTVVAAFDPKLGESSGAYLSDCQIATPAPHASDVNAANKLWHLSERQTRRSQSTL